MPQLSKEDATTFFSILFGGEHHIPGKLKEFGYGWSVVYRGDFATFDYNMLTRLVVLSHDSCIRASIHQGGPGSIKITLWRRQREGSMSERHPTMEDHVAKIRSGFPAAEIDRLQSQQL